MRNFYLLLLALLPVGTLGAQSVPKVPATAASADLDSLLEILETTHYDPYIYADSVALGAKLRAIQIAYGGDDSVAVSRLARDAMSLLAQLEDAHTSLAWWSGPLRKQAGGTPFFPLQLRLTPEGRLVDVASGKELVTIAGHSVTVLYQEALAHLGGNLPHRRTMTTSFFFAGYLWLRDLRPPFTIVYWDGNVDTLATGIGLKALFDRLRPAGDDYTFSVMPGPTGYLNYVSCNDAESFATFLEKTFQQIEQEQIEHLIIDVRNNTGGNSGLNDLLLPYLTQKPYRQSSGRFWRVSQRMKEQMRAHSEYEEAFGKAFMTSYYAAANGSEIKEEDYPTNLPATPEYSFRGKSCMLIGPKTFSSANFLADAVATYDIMPLIGQPTGELTNDFGEQVSVVLPHSGLSMTVATTFDIGADGDKNRHDVVHPDLTVKGDALEYALRWMWEED
ncbi:MAG: S41 family peptidase [Bacteroidota bacterium]